MTPKSVLREGEAPENPVPSPNPDNLAADSGGGGGAEVGSEVSWGHISRQLVPIPASMLGLPMATYTLHPPRAFSSFA